MPARPTADVKTIVYLKDTAHLTWRQIQVQTKVPTRTAWKANYLRVQKKKEDILMYWKKNLKLFLSVM